MRVVSFSTSIYTATLSVDERDTSKAPLPLVRFIFIFDISHYDHITPYLRLIARYAVLYLLNNIL